MWVSVCHKYTMYVFVSMPYVYCVCMWKFGECVHTIYTRTQGLIFLYINMYLKSKSVNCNFLVFKKWLFSKYSVLKKCFSSSSFRKWCLHFRILKKKYFLKSIKMVSPSSCIKNSALQHLITFNSLTNMNH